MLKIPAIELMPRQHYGSMTVVPLKAQFNSEVNYLLGGEAMSKGLVHVEEVSQQGCGIYEAWKAVHEDGVILVAREVVQGLLLGGDD